MALGPYIVLHVMKSPYGIPKSGIHWYLTYLEHHVDRLAMQMTPTDSCVLFSRQRRNLDGVVALQVEDFFGVGTSEFLELEGQTSDHFKCKPMRMISETFTTFNGVIVGWMKEGFKESNQSKIVNH